MLIAVLANDKQWKELLDSCVETILKRIDTIQEEVNADGYIILDEQQISALNIEGKPVLVNSVINTLSKSGAAINVCRINGWTGFLQRKSWEVAGTVTDEMKQIFTAMGKQFIEVADEPGLVAARTISMIINEAYFALGEEVSTKDEIDIAMKLGTNYPYGPFEWGSRIGVNNIYNLLTALYKKDSRYSPAPLLIKEATA